MNEEETSRSPIPSEWVRPPGRRSWSAVAPATVKRKRKLTRLNGEQMSRTLRLATYFALAIAAVNAAHARSITMSAGCAMADDSASQMRADAAWLAQMMPFAPEASPPALRVTDLRLETEQVLLARSGLRRTCSDYRAGRISEADADN